MVLHLPWHVFHSPRSTFALFLMITTATLFVLFTLMNTSVFSTLQKLQIVNPWKAPPLSHLVVKSPSTSWGQCPDVLHNMLTGSWEPGPMTSVDVEKMRLFHKLTREKEHSLPRGSQRIDRRCGNISVSNRGQQVFFRALCDPEGSTPCCYHSVCVNKTRQQCTCDDCLDMRTPLHAEYATWRPQDPSCQPRTWSKEEICRQLHNSTLHFIGDSLVRHVYTAFLLAARDDFQSGSFPPNITDEIRSRCSGLYMFTRKGCRWWLQRNASLCNGSLSVELCEPCHLIHVRKIRKAVLNLANVSRSLVFMEVGVHSGMDAKKIQEHVLKPLLKTMRSQRLTAPRLLWAGVHQFGMMRAQLDSVNAQVRSFNREIETYLAGYDVSVFDTYNLTHNVVSFDGTHFGYGVNAVKVNILMHYLQELQRRGEW